jgi:2-polyprenyl-3-methyl-5-hydroxy-6-metoxy-1,4-benzoquinol methylase
MNDEPSISCPVCAGASQYDISGRDLMFDRHRRYDYYRCEACDAVFQYPMPNMETIATFYPTDYDIYDEQERERKISRLRQALLHKTKGYAHLPVAWPTRMLAAVCSPFMTPGTPAFIPGGCMLDVGCGNGRYLSTMRSLGWQVQGVEFSAEGVRVCRMGNLPVHHGDLASAQFLAATFDLITVRHVIEHIPEPCLFMAELARVLKPGGHLLIETPNCEALGRAWLSVNWFANEVPRHLFLHSPTSLDRLALQAGLAPCGIRLSTTPKIFLNSLDYILRNREKPSKKIRWRRALARVYVWLAQRRGRGDVIHADYRKPS